MKQSISRMRPATALGIVAGTSCGSSSRSSSLAGTRYVSISFLNLSRCASKGRLSVSYHDLHSGRDDASVGLVRSGSR
eukprot:1564177-Prymnesium_polylepis.1